MNNLITEILAMIGGAGVILFGLSKFVGTIWQNRTKEKERRVSEESLELDRQNYGIRRVQADKYANSQYDIYIELWQSLQGMRLAVDALWENANEKNIIALSKVLQELRFKIDNWSIFFEGTHIIEINKLLNILEEFSAGKSDLVRIRYNQNVPRYFVHELEERVISKNKNYKEEFESVVEKMRVSFQKRLSQIN